MSEKIGKYYALSAKDKTATINIFGEITSEKVKDSDVSSYGLIRTLQELDVSEINVHINSNGGEVGEGLAIYNTLKNHEAKVNTICDGFACSAAAVIFMAGDTRIMNVASLLMVHPVWTNIAGNATALRKHADDLDTITQVTIETFKQHFKGTEEQLNKLLDNETWIGARHAVEMGFATEVMDTTKSETPYQSVCWKIVDSIIKAQAPARQVVDVEDVIEKLTEALAKIEPQQKHAEPEQHEPEQPQAEQPEQNKFINLLNALAKC